MGAITKEKKKLSPKALFSSPALVKSAAVLQKIGLFLAVVIMVCYFTFRAPRFILPYNILNIARQMVTLALLSYGLTFVLVGSGVDLSVGSNMSLVSVITALVMVGTGSIPLAIAAGLLTGLLYGTVNGYIVAFLNVQPFAATLGTMSVGSGVAFLISDGNTIRDLPDAFAFIGNGEVLHIPTQVWIVGAVTAVVYFLLQKTPFGSYCYAIGGNKSVAFLSGVQTRKIKMITFMLSGFLAAMASVIASSRCISGQPTLGVDMPLQAIAAAVIGGASMSGGRGTIGGTIIGVLFISILYSGMNFLQVSAYVQDFLIGMIIIGSAWIDASKRKKAG
jgi:ribose/xylose/arabinose/galactoside ABC-type transport system permease subunit